MSGERCACGHPEVDHWPATDGAELRPCGHVDPRLDYCPCAEYRPRRPAPLWIRAVNAVLGGRA